MFIFLAVLCFYSPADYFFARKEEKDGYLKVGVSVRRPKNANYKILNEHEYLALLKVKYNMPQLTAQAAAYIQCIKDAGFNIDLPVYKIEMIKYKSLKSLSCQLSSLKKLEDLGYALNIVISFNSSSDFSYADIAYLVSTFCFEMSVVKLHQTEFIGKDIMFAVNNLNINYPLGTQNDCLMAKSEPYAFNNDKSLALGREFYNNYIYKSSVCNAAFSITKCRTVSFKENYEIERIAITNLRHAAFAINVSSFFDFNFKDNEACYKQIIYSKSRLKITDFKAQSERYISSNINLYNMPKISKCGVKGEIKAKIKARETFYVYILKSVNPNLQVFDVVSGEKLYNAAKAEYSGFKLPVISSDNQNLNNLINKIIPERIIADYIFNPQSAADFFALIKLEPKSDYQPFSDINLNSIYLLRENMSQIYFNLLYQYMGIGFCEKGILVNPNKQKLIGGSISFCKDEADLCVEVKNNGIENGFKYNGVEYSGIRFLPYFDLRKKIELTM